MASSRGIYSKRPWRAARITVYEQSTSAGQFTVVISHFDWRFETSQNIAEPWLRVSLGPSVPSIGNKVRSATRQLLLVPFKHPTVGDYPR